MCFLEGLFYIDKFFFSYQGLVYIWMGYFATKKLHLGEKIIIIIILCNMVVSPQNMQHCSITKLMKLKNKFYTKCKGPIIFEEIKTPIKSYFFINLM